MSLEPDRLKSVPSNSLTAGPRQIIREGTEVLGGVFHGRNVIAVDFDENPDPYESAYRNFEGILPDASLVESLVLARHVVHAARQVMPFSPTNVRKTLRAEADARGLRRIREQDEVGLSRFVGGGTCQHQALFAGALLSLLQERRDIGGDVSVEWEPSGLSAEDPTRHIWVRYTKEDQRIILDDSNPELAFVLTRPVPPTDRVYVRPEEREELVDEEVLDPDGVITVDI